MVFVPDIGFRPSAGVALPRPVTVTKEDERGLMVLRLASTEYGTELAFEIRDAEREKACTDGRVDYTWPSRSKVRLREPGGAEIPWSDGPGNGFSMGQHRFGFFGRKAIFERLPADVRRVTLEVRGALGDWDVPLDLVPLTETDAPPVKPIGVEREHNGVTVRVAGMAMTDDRVVFEVKATAGPTVKAIEIGEWLLRLWTDRKDGFALIDEDGRQLEELSMRERMEMKRGGTAVVTFPRTESRTLTLVVPAVVLQEADCSLEFELPIYVPTDLTFGRHPVRIRYASFVKDLPAAPGEDPRPGIEIQMGTADWHRDHRVIRPGAVFVDGAHQGYSITGRSEPDFVSVNIPLAEGATARTVTMHDPVVAVRGPWELSFSRP